MPARKQAKAGDQGCLDEKVADQLVLDLGRHKGKTMRKTLHGTNG